jgi:hypothetical protein
VAQPLHLDPPAQRVLAAAGGPDIAAIVYLTSGGAPAAAGRTDEDGRCCRLAIVDLSSGTVRQSHAIAAPGEVVTSLALAGGAAETVAYLGLSRSGMWAVGDQRIVAVDARSGTMLATRRLAAAPAQLTLAPGVDRLGEWLYAVEPTDFAGVASEVPARARLLALDPLTLDLERDYTLPQLPWKVAISPDGAVAYSLVALGGSSLWRTDLHTGASAPLSALPWYGSDLVAMEDRIYVAHASGNELWVIDGRSGRMTGRIPAGRRPVALALGPWL